MKVAQDALWQCEKCCHLFWTVTPYACRKCGAADFQEVNERDLEEEVTHEN